MQRGVQTGQVGRPDVPCDFVYTLDGQLYTVGLTLGFHGWIWQEARRVRTTRLFLFSVPVEFYNVFDLPKDFILTDHVIVSQNSWGLPSWVTDKRLFLISEVDPWLFIGEIYRL